MRIAAADPGADDAGRRPWAEVEGGTGPPVRGGRSQAVHLPVPPGRHRHLPAGPPAPRCRRWGCGAAPGQLPHRGPGHRLGQPRLRPPHGRGARHRRARAPLQPDYAPLDAVRPGAPVGPPVGRAGPHGPPGPALGHRAAGGPRAADVAATVATVVAERWSVRDDETPGGLAAGPLWATSPCWCRPAPRCPFLEDALEAAGIPARTESSSLVYATRAVRDLLVVLRAVADPTDHLTSWCRPCARPLLACGGRRPVSGSGSSGTGTGARWTDQPASVPADDPVGHRAGPAARPARRAPLAGPGRAAGAGGGGAAGHGARPWPRAGRARRPVAPGAASWSTRPAPGTRPRAAGCATTCTGWSSRRRRGARVAEVHPARDRRRCRAHHDHPRGQGPRVPGHHRVRSLVATDHHPGTGRGGVPRRRGRAGLPLRRHGSPTREFTTWQPVDEQDGLRRAGAPALRGLHQGGRRPPGGVRAPPGPGQGPRSPPAAPTPSCWWTAWAPSGWTTCPELGGPGHPGRSARRRSGRRPRPPEHEWAAERTAALRRAGRPPPPWPPPPSPPRAPRTWTTTPHAGLRKRTARPRPAALAQGPLRHRRPAGAVHGVLQTVPLATRRPCRRRRPRPRPPSTRRWPPSARPRPCPNGPATCGATSSPPALRLAHRAERRRAGRTGGRGLRLRARLATGRLLEGYVDLLHRCERQTACVVVDYKTAATDDDAEELLRPRGSLPAAGARPTPTPSPPPRSDTGGAGHLRVPHARRGRGALAARPGLPRSPTWRRALREGRAMTLG